MINPSMQANFLKQFADTERTLATCPPLRVAGNSTSKLRNNPHETSFQKPNIGPTEPNLLKKLELQKQFQITEILQNANNPPTGNQRYPQAWFRRCGCLPIRRTL